MSLNDPILLLFDEKRQLWFLQRGRETFYDEENAMIMFDTKKDAEEWCRNVLGKEIKND